MKAVLLAGGKGTRLAPYTKILPKPLMPIGDMPILEILLHQMKNAGIHDVILTVGHLSQLLRAFFQDGHQFGMQINYSYEPVSLGTAGPIAMIEDLTDTFLVTIGDVLTTLPLPVLIDFHFEQHAAATIAMSHRKIKIDLGVIQSDGTSRINGYIEKPTYDYCVSMGIYIFEPRVIPYIPRGEYLDFPDLVKKMIASGERLSAISSMIISRTWGGRMIIKRLRMISRKCAPSFFPARKLMTCRPFPLQTESSKFLSGSKEGWLPGLT